MPQDAFHIKRLVQELRVALLHGKVNRVSQVDKDELTFVVYTGKTTIKLVISANATGARVCLAEEEKQPALVAPNFCMLLRKHLQGAQIVDIQQIGTERIIAITLYCVGDFSSCNRVLYCELMGKYSNVILTENGFILGALKTTVLLDESHRVLFPGAKYVYPAPQDKISPLDKAGMRLRIENYLANREETADDEDLAQFIFDNVAGFAIATARELVYRFRAQTLPLWEFISVFFETEPNVPHLQYSGEKPTDFFAFEIANGKRAVSLCAAQDTFYYGREKKKAFENKKRKLESAVRGLKKKAQKRLQDVESRLLESEKAEENRIKGELLTANLYAIQKGESFVELQNWYDEKGGNVKIALDTSLSPSKNAQRYFKTYNKQKRAKEILTPMKQKEEKEIAYLDSILSNVLLAETDEDCAEIQTELIQIGGIKTAQNKIGKKTNKKVEQEIPFREYRFNGYAIYVGRNNIQNDRLLRFADGEDVWLHTQKYHSSHVIVKTQGKGVDENTLLFCAEICAYYSAGQNGDKIPVDYCKRKYVKKPSKSNAGFVTYTDYKTVLVTPNAHKENAVEK